MFLAIRSSWPLLVGIALLMISNGTLLTLLGVRATLESFGTTAIALIMSSYSAGQLFGCVATPKIMVKVGHVRVFAAFASLASIAALIHMLYVDPWVWCAMRLLSGFCYAGLYVVAESWLNDQADNAHRGQLLSFYFITQTMAFGFGQYMIAFGNVSGIELFVLVSVLTSLALVPILLTVTQTPSCEAAVPVSFKNLFQHSYAGVISCFLNGMFVASFFGLGFVYAKETGLDEDGTASMMAIASLSAILLQYPIGRVSDKIDRRLVITGVALVSGAGAIALALMPEPSFGMLLLMIGIAIGLAMPIYSLAIAHTNDSLTPQEMISASSRMILIYGAGQVIGPYLGSIALNNFGPTSLFWYLAMIQAAIAFVALSRRVVGKASIPEEGGYQAFAAAATPVTAHLMSDEEVQEQWEELEETEPQPGA